MIVAEEIAARKAKRDRQRAQIAAWQDRRRDFVRAEAEAPWRHV